MLVVRCRLHQPVALIENCNEFDEKSINYKNLGQLYHLSG